VQAEILDGLIDCRLRIIDILSGRQCLLRLARLSAIGA